MVIKTFEDGTEFTVKHAVGCFAFGIACGALTIGYHALKDKHEAKKYRNKK